MNANRSRPGVMTEAATDDNKLAGEIVENGSHSTREPALNVSREPAGPPIELRDDLPEQPSAERNEVSSDGDAEAVAPAKMTPFSVVRTVMAAYDLGMSVDGQPYAVPKSPRKPKVAVSVKSLRGPLLSAMFNAGATASKDMVSQALDVVEAKASECEPDSLAIRCWQEGDTRVVIDLGRQDGTMVHVTADGWEVVTPAFDTTAGIRWRRTRGSEPLPVPQPGGSRLDVAKALSLDPASKQFRIVYGWLVAAVFADVKSPLLWFVGQQGSGKSTRGLMALRLVDPRKALGAAPGHNLRDDMVVANGRYTPSYDNIGTVSEGTSNFLCTMVTGIEFPRRGLYSDDDVFTSTFARSPIATSIVTPYGLKPDALQRIAFVYHERMPESERRTEFELEEEFLRQRPAMLGAIYSDVAGVLTHIREARAQYADKPRMADYGVVLRALDMHLGISGEDSFSETYARHVKETLSERAQSDPITAALMTLVPKSGMAWSGTPTALHGLIDRHRPSDPKAAWPRAANHMTRILNENAETLRAAGIVVVSGIRERINGKVANVVKLQNISGLVTDPSEVDPNEASLLARAMEQADGFAGHCILLNQLQSGVEVHRKGEGGFCILLGGRLDMSKWDAVSQTYNGQSARAWLQIDDEFKVA